MQTINKYTFNNRIQSLEILKEIIKQSHSGCLEIFSGAMSWSIFLEEGKLIYAAYSDNMFELIYQKLEYLNQQISSIYGDIYKRLLTKFETAIESQIVPNLDYLAICWLVNEKFISHFQAGILIENLAIEIINSLLQIEEGNYKFTANTSLNDMPKFCHIDVNELLSKRNNNYLDSENCQVVENKVDKNSKTNHIESRFTKAVEKESLQTSGKNLMVLPEKKTSKNSTENENIYQSPNEKLLYKIVCIDDSPTVLNSIKIFLDEEFFSVIAIKDPLKALMQIIREKPDLILLDITMPNLDGYELCSLLRRHSHLKKIPIIMVTGRSGFIDRAKAKMVRASGYLTKPFTQSELLKLVFQHLT
ncbi:response regulator [Calothrix rhizosoleniae]|uniref:response regulator n=1 Tax=Calothrix rhizosoleniae TaxID=888997 RepID=UPI00190F0764|nr:response regulator [Calothrix rhizosoleniae]